jgi:membrane protein required for colicin V production
MTWIDAVIVIVFLFFIVTGFSAGFIRETIGLASVILGAVLAGLFYENVQDTLLTSIDNDTTSAVVGFLVIFFAVTISGHVLAMLVHPAVTVLQLGIFDQLLGACLGAVKAFVIVEIVLIVFVTYPRYDLDQKINDSQFASVMVDGANPILKILPDVFQSKVDQFNG